MQSPPLFTQWDEKKRKCIDAWEQGMQMREKNNPITFDGVEAKIPEHHWMSG